MHDFKFNRKREETLEVGDANAISFLGPEGPRVLSTPNMILGMEQACRNLILEMLAPGHDSVGTHVNVAHKAAAPLGSTVVFSAELIEVNDRRAEFRVAATLNGKIVGDGFHQRAIIDVRRFASKVASDNPEA
jgi:predicted thioesterase